MDAMAEFTVQEKVEAQVQLFVCSRKLFQGNKSKFIGLITYYYCTLGCIVHSF